MTYPITGVYLDNLPEPMMEIFRDLEDDIFQYICEQFKQTGDANEKSIELIRQLQRGGLPMKEIEKRIRKALNLSKAEFNRVFEGAVSRNQVYYDSVLSKEELLGETVRETALQAEIAAIQAQTLGQFENITQSLGFAVSGLDGTVVPGSIQETYVRILDVAAVKVQSGTTAYTGAIRSAIDQLAASGLQWIDYPTGWHNRVEVAARRAVMTGVGQVCARYSEALKEDIKVDFIEVSAHRGARDKGVGPENHKSWQGRIYHVGGAITYEGVHYKDFEAVTGYGTGEGLNGWNCRHKWYPYDPDVMEPSYTEDELKNIDPPDFTFEGETYTAYEATQMQRKLETAMRAQKRKMIGFKAAGDDAAYRAASAKYRALSAKYTAFSKAAGLLEQRQRLYIAEKT